MVTHHEKYLYVKSHKYVIYTIGIFSLLCLLLGMFLFSRNFPFYGVFTLLTAVYLGLSYFIGIISKEFNLSSHEWTVLNDLKTPQNSTLDIFVTVCGEDEDMVKNTLYNAKDILWPTKNIYCLDDGESGSLKEFCETEKINYICRDKPRLLKKAGNLRNAFSQTSSDFILILDCDFIPSPEIALELMPYFHDTKIAIVQSPQYFRVIGSYMEKGASFIQELFYRLIQVNRNHFNASICVGTNAIYRRTALQKYGGTAAIEYSEDLHTGFMVTNDGWKVEYVPLNLAVGRCPEMARSFFTQQYRWCLGSFSLMLNPEFWKSNLNVAQKVCYMSGMLFYIASAITVIVQPLPGIVLLWISPDLVKWYNIAFSLPSFLYGTVVIALWSVHKFGFYSLVARNISYWSYLFAIIDKLRGSIAAWVPTGVSQGGVRFKIYLWIMPVWSVACYSMVIVGAGSNMDSLLDYDFYPIIIFSSLGFTINATSFWQSIRQKTVKP